ncbi:MAG TPA: hypothetical protein VMZ33_07930 [Candidatus Limnocylindrales bacterium]|nr:hypothetical protein [Candidatus Limnocylindrales bacterium]
MRVSVLMAVVMLLAAAAPTSAAPRAGGVGDALTGGSGGAAGSVGASGSPGACNDNKYTKLNPAARWISTLEWRFRHSSVPAGLNSGEVLALIKKSFRNVVNARNDCGLADRVSATHQYLGTTSRRPNVTRAGGCGAADGYNTVGFGPLDGYYSGYTCIWWIGAEVVEADVRLDTDTDWALASNGCFGELMMEALVTHEVGHAYNLGHVAENNHGRLTMSVYIDQLCGNQEATLGLGDVLGLESMY